MDAENILDLVQMSPKEKKIYVHLLAHNTQTQQDISEKTGILRQTVYEVVPQMERKGFVQHAILGKRKAYTATPPKTLFTQLLDNADMFKHFIPVLENLQLVDTQSHSKTFIGYTSLRNLLIESLENTSYMKWIQSAKRTTDVFDIYVFENFAKKRSAMQIPIKILTDEIGAGAWESNKAELRETRTHPIIDNKQVSVGITETKIILFTLTKDNLVGIYFENSLIASFFNDIFEMLWAGSESSEKKTPLQSR